MFRFRQCIVRLRIMISLYCIVYIMYKYAWCAKKALASRLTLDAEGDV